MTASTRCAICLQEGVTTVTCGDDEVTCFRRAYMRTSTALYAAENRICELELHLENIHKKDRDYVPVAGYIVPKWGKT